MVRLITIVLSLVTSLAVGNGSTIDWNASPGECNDLDPLGVIYGVDDFSLTRDAQLANLAPHLERFSSDVSKLFKNNLTAIRENPQAIVALAEQKLGSDCIRTCLSSIQTKGKALKLFASLKETVGKCDRRSYDILTRNYMAHMKFAYTGDGATFMVLRYYRERHAKHCRRVHTARFKHQISEVSSDDLDKLNRAFADLTIYDFGTSGEASKIRDKLNPFDLVGMEKPDFRQARTRRALVKIANQVADATELLPAEELSDLLDSNLFEPCERFRDQLGVMLNEARFDATVRDGKAQKDFLHGDKVFHRALVTNRLCGSLLEHQEELYALMHKSIDVQLQEILYESFDHPSDIRPEAE